MSGPSPGPPPPRSAPPTRSVPQFGPLRAGGRHRLRGIVVRRRGVLAAVLAVAAAVAAASPRGESGSGGGPGGPGGGQPAGPVAPAAVRPAGPGPGGGGPPGRVSAPVRIADAGVVRLLEPGDRVDVLAAGGTAGGDAAGSGTGGGAARVLVRAARVAQVPEEDDGSAAGEGALVVLAVSRQAAAELAGAGATYQLAVTLR